MLQRLLIIGLLVASVSAYSEEVDDETENERVEDDPEERIIGGLPVPEGAAGYVVYLKVYDELDLWLRNCGGTVLNTTLILTSAACIYGSMYIDCYAGSVDNQLGTLQKSRGVGVIHPSYGKNSIENDIGIVRLQTALQTGPNTNVAIVPLPKKIKIGNDKQAGKVVTLFGWGYASVNAVTDSQYLILTNMTVLKTEACKTAMKPVYYKLSTTSFCTDTLGVALGFCKHDLGGPVMFYDAADRTNNNFYLVGIMSDNFDCNSEKPNVFTSLYHFTDWIYKMGGPRIV